MTDDTIYGIMAEVTGHEKEYLQLGHETQMVRPSEVVEIVNKAIIQSQPNFARCNLCEGLVLSNRKP